MNENDDHVNFCKWYALYKSYATAKEVIRLSSDAGGNQIVFLKKYISHIGGSCFCFQNLYFFRGILLWEPQDKKNDWSMSCKKWKRLKNGLQPHGV